MCPRSWDSASDSIRSSFRPRARADGATDLADLDTVGQPRAVVVTLVIDEDLGLVLESPEGATVNDAVAVALVSGTVTVSLLGVAPTSRVRGPLRVPFEIRGVREGCDDHGHHYYMRAPGLGHMAKLEPQPQVPVAFGFSILKPEPARLSR